MGADACCVVRAYCSLETMDYRRMSCEDHNMWTCPGASMIWRACSVPRSLKRGMQGSNTGI
eukprot:1142135-Pelagomonas_calceolata.AAC.5